MFRRLRWRRLANVDISAMTHLRALIAMLHKRSSFSNGLAIPLLRPVFYGPPNATPEETPEDIESEIARNADQFDVISKSSR